MAYTPIPGSTGIAGGQTIVGGTATGQSLTLKGNSVDSATLALNGSTATVTGVTGASALSVVGGIANNDATNSPLMVGNTNSLSAGNAYIAQFFCDNMSTAKFQFRGDGVFISTLAIRSANINIGTQGTGYGDGPINCAILDASTNSARFSATIRGGQSDAAANVAVKLVNYVAMTSGRDRSVVGIYKDNGTTKIADFYPDGGANFTGKLNFASGVYAANGSVATAMSSLGPAGSHTTIQKWLTIYDSDGTTILYIPCF